MNIYLSLAIWNKRFFLHWSKTLYIGWQSDSSTDWIWGKPQRTSDELDELIDEIPF